jgi:hypothetical protein
MGPGDLPYFHRIKDVPNSAILAQRNGLRAVEVASVPFLKFVANKGIKDEAANYSFGRGYVRHWLANVWSEFDRIWLTDLSAPANPARVAAKIEK